MSSLSSLSRTIPRQSASLCRALSSRRYSALTPVIQSSTHDSPNSVGYVKHLQLNRPSAKNAISRQLLSELKQHLDELDCSPRGARVLVVSSAVPGVFCAGADLKERKGFSAQQTRQFLSDLRATFAQLANLPIPTISAIQGYALGGGLELALTTTLRVAHHKAILGLPETRLGIIPGAGATHRLPKLVGRSNAMRLILSGETITPEQALRLGLVNDVVAGEEETVVEEALKLASTICKGAPIATIRAFNAINRSDEGQPAENEEYEALLHTKDRLEALAAFTEKRKPNFKGE